MMNNYFDNCRTAEELKAAYRKAAVKLHPDNNAGKDTTAAFQDMQQQFERAWARFGSVHKNAEGETYTKETSETAAEFMDLINVLLKFAGVNVELCGSWVWLTGNTKEFKNQLKTMGFKWSRNKAAWYYHREPYHKRSKKKCTLDEIRGMYGSLDFGTGAAETSLVF